MARLAVASRPLAAPPVTAVRCHQVLPTPPAAVYRRRLIPQRQLPAGRRPALVIGAAAGGAGPSPGDKASELLSNVTGALGKAKEFKLDFGITSLLQYNFAAQLALTVVSWGVLFTTLHQGVANGHPVITFPILCNLVGVLLSAFSAWMSFTYFMKAKEMGEAALDGFKMMNEFFGHLSVNFFGAAAAIVGLQAEVGTMFASAIKAGAMPALVNGNIAALAQAAANTLLAHLVSIIFLTYLIRKIALAYKKLIEWSEGLVDSVAKLN
mmetsp:Transcript_15019/g.38176  ORF Transcript_15019/g.38176 Transcript_15019/m.38176 type:complete len:267 (-) Transcript_15019:317-1117(-)